MLQAILFQQRQDLDQLIADISQLIGIYRWPVIRHCIIIPVRFQDAAVELVACAADGEALLIQELADTTNQQHFMMLVITAVAASLDWALVGELPVPLNGGTVV